MYKDYVTFKNVKGYQDGDQKEKQYWKTALMASNIAAGCVGNMPNAEISDFAIKKSIDILKKLNKEMGY